MPSPTIIDQYGHANRFKVVLVVAELRAANHWEIEFTNDLRRRFEKRGHRMPLSDLQRNQLNRIAGED
jgi:hypothetical protein